MGASEQKTALITGASGGIGLELAKLFARDGYNLVLVARSEEKLHRLADTFRQKAGVGATVIPADLADPSAAQRVFDEVQAAGIQVDALVNNAGYSIFGEFANLDLQRQVDLLEVNIMTLTRLSRLFVPGMVERGRGKILNVASTSAFEPGPYMAVYYASKSYVLLFSEAIGYELRKTGVSVTCLCPGPTRSGFQDRAGMHESRLMSGYFMDTKRVAGEGYRALMKGRPVIVPGVLNWLQVELVRFSPRRLITALSGWATGSR